MVSRRPVRMADDQAEGDYTDEFEIACCDCRNDPDLNYCEVSPELRWICGPYPMVPGVTEYVRHAKQYPGRWTVR